MTTANPSLDLCHRMGEGRGPPVLPSDGRGRRPATARGHQAATAAAVRSQGTIAALLGVDLQPPSPLEADPQPPPPLEVDPARNRRTRGRPTTAAVSVPPPEVDPQPLCSRTEGTHTERMVREEIGMNRGRIKIRTHTSGTTVCR
jgi:hypothetical protein